MGNRSLPGGRYLDTVYKCRSKRDTRRYRQLQRFRAHAHSYTYANRICYSYACAYNHPNTGTAPYGCPHAHS